MIYVSAILRVFSDSWNLRGRRLALSSKKPCVFHASEGACCEKHVFFYHSVQLKYSWGGLPVALVAGGRAWRCIAIGRWGPNAEADQFRIRPKLLRFTANMTPPVDPGGFEGVPCVCTGARIRRTSRTDWYAVAAPMSGPRPATATATTTASHGQQGSL